MPFKQDYAAAVERTAALQPATYGNPATALYRIQRLYGAARLGNLGRNLGTRFWDTFFNPLRNQFTALPATQQGYDNFAIQEMRSLAQVLRQHNRGDFGIAQKMFNLFLKDHWSLSLIPPQSEPLLHIPLDRQILAKLRQLPPTWKSWTKAVEDTQTLNDYLGIQQSFRNYWHHVNSVRP